jgi:ribonucleoside-triphosphate reductase
MTAKRDVLAIDKDIAATKEALANVRGTETEVYARIVGYYRSVRNWNKGKRDEFNHRKMFSCDCGETTVIPFESVVKAKAENRLPEAGAAIRYEFFGRKTCPNCPPVKAYLAKSGMDGASVDVDTPEGLKKAQSLGITSAPTVILYDHQGGLAGRVHSVAELCSVLEPLRMAV